MASPRGSKNWCPSGTDEFAEVYEHLGPCCFQQSVQNALPNQCQGPGNPREPKAAPDPPPDAHTQRAQWPGNPQNPHQIW